MKLLQGLAVYFIILGLPSATVAAVLTPDDIDAIGRTAYAESGSFLGRLGVVETILNRLHDGGFGRTVNEVVNARNQFEPVTKAGGWRNLPELTAQQMRDVHEIIWLHEQNTVTIAKGATFFQNESIVADRAAKGQVRAELVGFNGMRKVSEWNDGHTFYSPKKTPSTVKKPNAKPAAANKPRIAMMVFGGN